MTPEQKALKYWHLFVAEKGHEPMPFEFAAFCLDKREKQFTKLRDLLERLADIQNGPPLIRDEKEWRGIMDKSYALLKETETLNASKGGDK
jgi:hypothetical protein